MKELKYVGNIGEDPIIEHYHCGSYDLYIPKTRVGKRMVLAGAINLYYNGNLIKKFETIGKAKAFLRKRNLKIGRRT